MTMGPTEIFSSSTEGFVTSAKNNFTKKLQKVVFRQPFVAAEDFVRPPKILPSDSGESVESRFVLGAVRYRLRALTHQRGCTRLTDWSLESSKRQTYGGGAENRVQGHRHRTDSLGSDSNADDHGTTGNSVTASDAGCHG